MLIRMTFSDSFSSIYSTKNDFVHQNILFNSYFFIVHSIKYLIRNESGDLNKTTNSTGLLNYLVLGEIDLAAYSIVRTPERAKAFHFFYDLNSARY